MNNTDYNVDLEIRNEFIDEALDDLISIANLFVEMESGSAEKDTVDRIFRVAHTIKGNSAYFELMKIKVLAHKMEDVVSDVRQEVMVPSPRLVSILLAAADELKAMLIRVKNGEPEMVDQGHFDGLVNDLGCLNQVESADQTALWEELIETLESGYLEEDAKAAECVEDALALAIRLGKLTSTGRDATANMGLGIETTTNGPEPTSSSGEEPGTPETSQKEQSDNANKKDEKKTTNKTMRVTEASIDSFLAYVGDLVVIREMYEHLQTRLAGRNLVQDASEMRRVNDSFIDLSMKLQNSIMDIRKAPIGNLMQRSPRIIRDVATAKGKKIETVISGADVMIDKSLIETLEGPLIHMVRNAADHGVEIPADRLAAGKNPVGKVWISAEETPETITISVRDDGKGLDRTALGKKGVEMGLIEEGQELTESVILKLLFSPGVSTAESVSDISGRGVGMDVVRSNIEEMGGSIRVSSEQGKGSIFTIEMKKTVNTQIIDGFAIIDQDNPFIIPMDRVIRCFRPGECTIQGVMDKGVFVRDGDELIAVYNFGRICGVLGGELADPTDSILIVLHGLDEKIALQVDGIDSVKQVVLKDVEGLHGDNKMFVGGAVMGDGKVAMILDVDELVKEALNQEISLQSNPSVREARK